METLVVMNIQQRNTGDISELPEEWPICIRRIMATRGIVKADELTFDLTDLPKPSQMLGMEAAVALLIQALQQQWRVMIVADFDSDGATSCAVMMRGLCMMGLQHIDFIVPNRFVHGYGLTTELLNEIDSETQPDLLITVDNGIASLEGVSLAKQRGMQVLITDHHLAAEQLPEADAIVNPNQPGDSFPSKMLAGVGVAFYVLLGLRQGLRDNNWFELQQLAEPRALLQIAGKDISRLSAQDLGFAIAPRLNAAGRMEDMGLGIDTLLTDNFVMAQQAAQLLDQINLERRSVEQGMQLEALAMLEKLQLNETSQATAYCLYEESWHQGVIGLLASRIKEKLHRPVIVFAPGEPGEIKGSARSITGVHIRDVLVNVAAKYPDLILRFGGHAMAAGLTLKQNDFSLFEQAFREAIQLAADPTVFERALYSDGELSAQELNMQLAEQLPVLAPWGQAFPEPQFHGQFVLQNYRHVGQQSDHLRLTVKLDDGRELTAMAFRQTAPVWLQVGQKVGLHYRLDVNEFRQSRSLQLLVDNILPS